MTKRFDRLVACSGLPRIRLHDCRHTAATALLEMGLPLKVVTERLGHSSTQITSETRCGATRTAQVDRFLDKRRWKPETQHERGQRPTEPGEMQALMDNSQSKTLLGFVLVLIGIAVLLVAFLVAVIVFDNAADVGTALAAISGTIGSLVGAFFGIQLGGAGKERAEDRKDAEADKAQKLAAVGDPKVSAQILGVDKAVVDQMR